MSLYSSTRDLGTTQPGAFRLNVVDDSGNSRVLIQVVETAGENGMFRFMNGDLQCICNEKCDGYIFIFVYPYKAPVLKYYDKMPAMFQRDVDDDVYDSIRFCLDDGERLYEVKLEEDIDEAYECSIEVQSKEDELEALDMLLNSSAERAVDIFSDSSEEKVSHNEVKAIVKKRLNSKGIKKMMEGYAKRYAKLYSRKYSNELTDKKIRDVIDDITEDL